MALAVTLAMAMACSAQEIKVHDWPCAFSRLTITDLEIPVFMDIEKVYSFFAMPATIRLEEVDEGTYSGCSPLVVMANFDLTVTSSIEPTGVVPGEYSCSIDPPEIIAPLSTVTVCAEVKNAQLDNLPAGRRLLTVAVIKVRVAPK